jgi:hypothetical protein
MAVRIEHEGAGILLTTRSVPSNSGASRPPAAL